MSRRPRLILSQQALAENYHYLSSFLKTAECAASVKANAYGLGIEFAAPVLWDAGCRTYFVAYLEEAVQLRVLLPEAIIYVFHGLVTEEIESFRQYRIRPVVNNIEQARLVSGICLDPAIHFDTGMRRLGIPLHEIESLGETIGSCQPSLLMSHLACADEPRRHTNREQLGHFQAIQNIFGLHCSKTSLANTAGIFLGEAFHFDLVRPGIGLYGGSPDPSDPKGLKAVVTWEARVLQINQVVEGQSIGYGGSFIAKTDMWIATIGTGYADGYLRALSGHGFVSIEEYLCPLVGRVSMDLISVDVTSVVLGQIQLRVGSWVELMGSGVGLDDLAHRSGTIAYECLTRIGSRVERNII